MLIAYVHNRKAILPEIAAYRGFFEGRGLRTIECLPADVAAIQPDIEWHFMGTHFRRASRNNMVIHEYASLSSPPLRTFKDFVKRKLNTLPDFRIFQNEYTRSAMGFTDRVPWGYRSVFYFEETQEALPESDPLYDFMYAGTLDPSREPQRWLDCFATGGSLQGHRVLVLSRPDLRLQARYQESPNIVFKGEVAPGQVGGYLSRCRFAINYQPDKAPFNQQPSGKLLTYCAGRIPVISTDYAWIREFQQQFGGKYFFLEPNLSNFTWENLENFSFEFPALDQWSFLAQLKRSGVCNFLAEKTGRPELALIE